MIFQIIDITASAEIGGLPKWAAVLVFIGVFIVTAVIAGYFSHKAMKKKLGAKNKKKNGKNGRGK